MKNVFVILILLALKSLAREDAKPIDSSVNRILIINSFDAMSMKARKNKKELFAQLADSLKQMLSLRINESRNTRAIVIPGIIINSGDSGYYRLINEYQASAAIVISKLDAYFEQTGVEVTKEPDGKKRVASYNICSTVNYSTYNNAEKINESETKVWEFFTTRSVVSGFLAAGPDIVGKSKHAFNIIEKNAGEYLIKNFAYLRND